LETTARSSTLTANDVPTGLPGNRTVGKDSLKSAAIVSQNEDLGIRKWEFVSRQNEKFLIGQSRRFLLTAKSWKAERIAMNQEVRDWLEWLKRAYHGMFMQGQADERMGVSIRWVRKLLVGMKTEGYALWCTDCGHGYRTGRTGRIDEGARREAAQTAGVV
jgi:hypothetical protein